LLACGLENICTKPSATLSAASFMPDLTTTGLAQALRASAGRSATPTRECRQSAMAYGVWVDLFVNT
jgi:hypothetical protein